jgi:hypothetical protein
MSTKEDNEVLKYAESFNERYMGKLLLAGQLLRALCRNGDLNRPDPDWVLERRIIITSLDGNINRYGPITR